MLTTISRRVLTVLLVSFISRISYAQTTYYVSPNGSDQANGTISSPFASIVKAKEMVRKINVNMKENIVIYLRGGTYTLSSTLTFDQYDSGTNGYSIIYMNYANEHPIISGGVKITHWTLHEPAKNIYQAKINNSFDFRQLYVNGNHAVRARSADGKGWTINSNGYTCPKYVASWKNIGHVEVVHSSTWKFSRGHIKSAKDTSILMEPDYWTKVYKTLSGPPVWIENAYELLDSENEWYLDNLNNIVYYKPKNSEKIDDLDIFAPKLEFLIKGSNLKNVQFKGLTFEYSTWLYPNLSNGFPHVQADAVYSQTVVQIPGTLTFDHCSNLVFENNIFEHLGMDGLQLFKGCKNNLIHNNTFQDISGSAISIGLSSGGVYNGNLSDYDVVKNNTVSNNLITDVAVEYQGSVGILIGFTTNSVVKNNEVCNLPYTGISVGWGWSHTRTKCGNNHIEYNYIHDYMKSGYDGGAIYTLSNQPNSTCSFNYIDNYKIECKGYGWSGIYLDQGTEGFECNSNLIKIKQNKSLNWLFIQPGGQKAINNSAHNNYTNSTTISVSDGNDVTGTKFVPTAEWTKEAIEIIKNAGRH